MVEVKPEPESASWRQSAHGLWMKAAGVPIHRGYSIPDLRTIELGYWEERECNAAFLHLVGQEEVCELRVTEIPPGGTLPPLKFALDELVYVLKGRGSTTVWDDEGTSRFFEWEPHAMFRLPRHYHHQFSNMHGSEPARLLHYNYLPCAMAAITDPAFFYDNDALVPDFKLGEGPYAESKAIMSQRTGGPRATYVRPTWVGNFFPDLAVWEQLHVHGDGRDGARNGTVSMHFPDSPIVTHMPEFPPATYKTAHRHGPGFAIVIPVGEGFSIMFEEGKEKIICPWQEGSIFVPPSNWYHHHFNLGAGPMRYLAFHPPAPFAHYEQTGNDADEIDFPDEDPWIRQYFEEELAKRGLKSAMPQEIYTAGRRNAWAGRS